MNLCLDVDETRHRMLKGTKLLAAALLAAVSTFAGAAQTYDITNLSLGGTVTLVSGLGATGQAIGYAATPGNSALHAFVATRADGMIDLGTLGGTNSFASAINASGQVVGQSQTATGPTYHAFSWTRAGGMVDLGTRGGNRSTLSAINDSGQVIGYWQTDGVDEAYAFSWTQSDGMVDLGTLGGHWTNPIAINASGQVTGISFLGSRDDFEPHAFRWTQADGMKDLGTLGGVLSEATAINASGHVVGWSTPWGRSGSHAFLWTPEGGMVDLGTVGGSTYSTAIAITDSGMVVGNTLTPSIIDYHAFAWTAAGGMVDIGSLGGNVTQAIGVSASGQVIGYSTTADNVYHGFSWTQAGGMVDLGTLGGNFSNAKANNALGHVVGRSLVTGDTAYHAFIHDGVSIKDLNNMLANAPAGMELDEGFLLSASGAIVASSNVGNVLLTPSAPLPAAPVVGPIEANDPVAAGALVSVSANFTDANVADSHTAVWDWGDGGSPQSGTVTESAGSGTAKGSHTYAASGIYTLRLAVTDSSGRTSNVSSDVVVYDSSAGFVSGNGWIQSPPGAFKAQPAVTGNANFRFVAKYKKGTTLPEGMTEFEFKAAGLDFNSDAYEWMVVSGARAQFKGTGELNGAPDYEFLLTAIDGKVIGHGAKDHFRIKIWHYDANLQRDVVVYDNQLSSSGEGTPSEGTVVGHGSIVIHAPPKK